MESVPPEGLQDKRYITLILRLLIDKHGGLVHGEVADMDGTAGPRFAGWRALTPAVQEWLVSIGHGE